ncbi:10071_t:CDS:2 [Funneliformis caledonium]|uniref:10071_t:CDS:1 n=1 Tax=Funneliformis caledonium TaxID=1117310 RepID=A0A9N8WMA3_9GLOM|nr:10071_t:CDS:2 [Funneliformis caledonium]
MQEVEVAPRDVFIHYVNVPKGQTILWWFSTKKKNISFGLYQRKGPAVSARNVFVAATTTSNAEVRNPLEGGSASSRQNLPPTPSTAKSVASRTSVHSVRSRTSIDTNDADDNEEIPGGYNAELDTTLHDPVSSLQPTSPVSNRGRKKSVSAQIIKDPDLKEILPIEHYNSASTTIKGSYIVQEEGTYCLCFGVEDQQKESQPEIGGWMLKKKRKKMQGWAKRWVQIDNGVLSHFVHPHGPCRGTIHIALSAVSSSANFLSINLDSGTSTYHLKALTNDDFDRWMIVIRKYVNISKDLQLNDPAYPKMTSPRQSMDFERRQSIYLKRQSLLEKRNSLHRDTQGFLRMNNKMDEDLGKLYGAFNSMDDNFRSIKELLDHLKISVESPSSPVITRSPGVEGKFRLKKFPITRQRGPTPLDQPTLQAPTTPTQMAMEQIYERLNTTFSTLKTNKEQAFELLRAEIEKWKQLDHAYRKLAAEQAELRKTLSDEKLADVPEQTQQEVSNLEERREARINRADSVCSFNTVSAELFFDAEDIELKDTTDSDNEIIDEETEETEETEDEAGTTTEEIIEEKPIVNDVDDNKIADKKPITIRRRKCLPSPVCGEDVSLLSILRKNVGKDLSTIVMPISLNEPLNALQRMAEELEYSHLLDKAATIDDSISRLIYVSAFAVSGYAFTQYRALRKPFNPLHGETFEFVRSDKGFRFISEKVSHYPPIMACHAESENWQFWQESKAKTKFWGKSMEIIPSGTTHVTIPKYNDHYTFSKTTTWMRNMISGTKYLEHTGVMKIKNQTTGEACEVTFVQSGLWSNGPKSEIVGVLHNAKGGKCGKIVGRWTEIIFHEIGPNQLEVIWKANSPIPDHEQYYGFSQFAVELNELTPDLVNVLPRTDTRFRPDQRLFEEGNLERAEAEKLRVEQKQRDFRKFLEQQSKTWEPQWFKFENGEWVYKGGYWEARESKSFDDKIELW